MMVHVGGPGRLASVVTYPEREGDESTWLKKCFATEYPNDAALDLDLAVWTLGGNACQLQLNVEWRAAPGYHAPLEPHRHAITTRGFCEPSDLPFSCGRRR